MGYPIYHSAYTAAQIEAAIGKGPRVNASGFWEVWNVSTGAYESTGVGAGVTPPTVVTQVSQMTNHGYIYIYNGSETGYTAGYWYYWDGIAWTAGGAYQVAATDPTLSIAGAAADAKATGDAVDELKSATNELSSGEAIQYTDGDYIVNKTIYHNSTHYRLGSIQVNPGEKYILVDYLSADTLQLAFYNSNGNIISTSVYNRTNGTLLHDNIYRFELTAPSSAASFKFTEVIGHAGETFFSVKNGVVALLDKIVSNKNLVDSNISTLMNNIEAVRRFADNIADDLTYTADTVIVNGAIATSDKWKLSEAIPVYAGLKLYLQLWLSADTIQVAFFNSSNTIVELYDRTDGTVLHGAVYEFELAVPNGASYFRFSCTQDATHVAETKFCYLGGVDYALKHLGVPNYGADKAGKVLTVMNDGNVSPANIPGVVSPIAGKKVLVLGDSISTNAYHTPGEPAWNKWASYLSNECGFTLVNDSYHATGFVINNGVNGNLVTRVQTHVASENYDIVIIFAGVNDHKGNIEFGDSTTSDASTYEYAAMSTVLTYLINTFPKAVIFGLLPLQWSGKDAEYHGLNLGEYVDKMVEVYDKFSVPTLNLYKYGGFRGWNSAFNTQFGMLARGPSGMVHDGLHPNQEWDNNYLAPQIKGFLEKYLGN